MLKKKLPVAVENWINRLILIGLGLIALAGGLGGFIPSLKGPVGLLLLASFMSLPFMVVGVFLLFMGIFGRPSDDPPSEGNPPNPEPRPAARGHLMNRLPEGKLEDLLILLAYGWLGVCVIALFKGLHGLISSAAPSASVGTWCVLLVTGGPLAWWVRRREQFHKRWGRCKLHLDRTPALAKPFAGAVEAETRFAPTKDFHVTLLYEERDFDGTWWERSKAELVVPRNQMVNHGPRSRVPFAFETLSEGEQPYLKFDYHQWRLILRTELDGQPYEESFTGEITVPSK